jgi:hypothetical protein
VPEELKERVLSEDEVREFNDALRKEIENEGSKVYVAVTAICTRIKRHKSCLLWLRWQGKRRSMRLFKFAKRNGI